MQQLCPKCHYPLSHPFGLTIVESECSGCFTHREKDVIDWNFKYETLEEITRKYKNRTRKYDCVVPVVGDAEDYFTLLNVLKLGLSPLVVCVNDYFKNDIGWHNLHNLITYFDVDSFTFNPDLRVYKDLVRTSLRKHENILLPYLQLHTSFPVHVALERNIPLIIWGQNQPIEQAGKFSHVDEVEMSRWSRRQHDLFNLEIDDLIGNGAQVDLRHLNYYQYPDVGKLSRNRVRGIYLSNYIRWDPLAQNQAMVEHGFQPEKNNASFDIYERAGSSVYYQLHDLLKLKRVGYRKVNDHVAREIRHGRLTSEEGLLILDHYSQTKAYIKPFFNWLGVTKSGYDWFKMHRLGSVGHLINDDIVEPSLITMPTSLDKMIENSRLAKENYLIFGKGI